MAELSTYIAGLPISAFALLAGILVPCLVVSLYLSLHRSRLLFTGGALWITIEILRIAMTLNVSLSGIPTASDSSAADIAISGMLASYMVVMLLVPQAIATEGSAKYGWLSLYCRVQALAYLLVLVASAVSGTQTTIAPWVSSWCLINGAAISAACLWRAARSRQNLRLMALCWAFGFGLTSLLLMTRPAPAIELIVSGDPLWIGTTVARVLFVGCGIMLLGLYGREPVRRALTRNGAEGRFARSPARGDTVLAGGSPDRSRASQRDGASLPLSVGLATATAGAGAGMATRDLTKELAMARSASADVRQRATVQVDEALRGPTAGTVALETDVDASRRIAELAAKLSAANAQLLETADLQRQVSSLLSHELRAPLATISAAAQSLDLILSGSGELVDGRIARIRRSVGRMTELLEAFFSAERTESGPLSPIYQEVDLSVLSANVIAQQQPDVSHTLVLDAPRPVMAWCDPSLCAVVLRNLTHNAIKYSPANRPIVVRVRDRQDGEHTVGVISVIDLGAGIDTDEIERIFDRSYRRPSHREVKGTGIGLYLARRLCEHQSGHLEVESTVGAGSRFFMTLPGQRPTDA